MTRVPHQARERLREELDHVEFGPDGRVSYVDSHLTGDQRRILLAAALLASCDDQGPVEEALEALEALLDEAG